MFDHIEGGDTLDYFCDHFHIAKETAVSVLELAREGLLEMTIGSEAA